MRREQARPFSVWRDRVGAPPRARGADLGGTRHATTPGSIPACAGSSFISGDVAMAISEHPRVRGEQHPAVRRPRVGSGASPRARGAVGGGRLGLGRGGSIPACAGSSPPPASRPGALWEHPRVRGEQDLHPQHGVQHRGASPRARGADPVQNRHRFGDGSIPACAGSRRPSGRFRTCPWEHPRVRGEQLSTDSSFSRSRGASPRARGAGPLHQLRRRVTGSIPACAGSRLDDLRTYRWVGAIFATCVGGWAGNGTRFGRAVGEG